MLKKNVSKMIKTGAFVTFLSTLTFLTSFSVESQATSTYYIRVLFDEGSFGLVNQIIPDKGEGKEPIERAEGVNFSNISDYNDAVTKSKNSLISNIKNKNPETTDQDYKTVLENTDDNRALTFSFPGITQATDSTSKYTAMSSDSARAELVGNTLTKGANDALAFIRTYTKAEHIGAEGLRIVADKLGARAIKVQSTGSDVFNTGNATATPKGFSIYKITGPDQTAVWSDKKDLKVGDELIPVNGLKYDDYVAIGTTANGAGTAKVYGYFPWRMEKGYHSEQILADLVGEEYVEKAEKLDKDKKPNENKYITWAQLFIQAGVNADVRGTTSVDSASDTMTLIGQGLGADFTNALTSMRSMLSLSPIQELILNMGGRASTHYLGAMTQDMFQTAKSVYVLVLIVSMLILSMVVINTIQTKMLSTANIVARVSFMEKLQDLIVVGVMLAIFPSVFELLLELNFWIVKTFSFSSSYLQAYGITGNKIIATESLAGAMISSMFLGVDAYINMTYLVRSIALAFLFAISPFVTVLYPNGPMQKKMFIAFLREVVGTIFMQSFHALTMCFFAGYNTTNMSAMEALVSTYCFIPLTQLFKQFVIGYSGFAESVGGKLAGQLTNTASGIHKSGVMMKQTKEMMDMQAQNAKNTSIANFGAQMLGITTDIAGSALQGSISSKEIGSSAISGAMKGASKSGGSAVGSTLKSAGASLAVGGIGALTGGLATGLTEKINRNEMGKMQMEHSMQNIGMGLAQTGVGLGLSSYDAGAGSSMINGGIGTIQAGAKQAGESESNTGAGGANLAWSAGIDTFSYYGGRALGGSLKNAVKYNTARNEELSRLEQQAMIEKRRGLDVDGSNAYNNTSNYLGMKSAQPGGFSESNPSPIAKIEAHANNTDSSTIVLNPANLKNASSDDALANLGNVFDKYKDANNPEVKQAWEKASREYGVSQTIAPSMTSDGKIAIVLDKVSRHGFEVDSSGKTYTSSESLNSKKQ